MNPSSRLGPRKDLRNNRDPFLDRENIRDIFNNDSTPFGRRSTLRGMETQPSDFGDFPSRSSEDFWNRPRPSRFQSMGDDMENFMRKRREGSPFSNAQTPSSSTSNFAQPGTTHSSNSNDGPSPTYRQGSVPRATTPESNSPKHFTSRFNFNFDNGNAQSEANDGRQPVVHHIPIHVEPRGNLPKSPGYSSENAQNHSQGNMNRDPVSSNQTYQDSSENSQPLEQKATGARHTRQKSSPPKSSSPIPLPEPPPHSTSPIPLPGPQISSPIPLPEPASNIRAVPVSVPREENEEDRNSIETPSDLKRPHSRNSIDQKTMRAIKMIEEARKATHDLESSINHFQGVKNDKEYLYLDEMLTRNLIRLDNVNIDGNEEIRSLRKAAVLELSQLTQRLEFNSQKNMKQLAIFTGTADKNAEENIENAKATGENMEVVEETLANNVRETENKSANESENNVESTEV